VLSAASALAVALAIAATSAPVVQPAATLPPDRPFSRIVPNLVDDIRALPSAPTAVLVAAGSAAALAVHPVDDDLSAWAGRLESGSYTGLGHFIGDGWIQAAAAVATYAVGVGSNRPRTAHVGADLIRGQLLAGIITRVTKVAVDRTRPNGGGHSFPSGHASASFLSAAVLEGHLGWKVGGPAYGVASYIAWARVRDLKHWLSDVVVGATVGIVVGQTVTGRHGGRAWTIVPSASTAGVGVLVVKR
jgi:membrane-associated phospholipid phosphatase